MSSRSLRSLGTVVVIGVLVSTMSAGSAATEGARIAGNRRVNTDPRPVRAHEVPALAVNPRDPRHIVEVDQEYRYEECEYHVTFDGGKTWKGGQFTGPEQYKPLCAWADSGGYPRMNGTVAFGSKNNVYTTFSSRTAFGDDSVLVAKSVDGGRTFAPAVIAIPSGGGSVWTRPELVVDPDPAGDKIYLVAWELIPVVEGGCCGGDIVASTSTDGGETFSAPVNVNSLTEVAREQSQPVVAADGSIHVAYQARPGILMFASSTDQGDTWTRRNLGTENGLFQPKLAIDKKSGAMYIAFQASKVGDNDAWLRSSTDGGETWSDAVRVNDDAEGNLVHQGVPYVSVGPGGRVDVTWYDRRHFYPGAVSSGHFGANVTLEDIYYANSTDEGKTFSVNRRVTDRTNNRDVGVRNEVGLYWGAPSVPLGKDKVMVAWSDSRFGNADTDTQDILTATIDLSPEGTPPVKRISASGPTALGLRLSKLAYPGGGEERRGVPVTKVIVVGRRDLPGALVASVLARANPGPILLAGSNGLSKTGLREVARLNPAGAFVVGSEESVPTTVVSQLQKKGIPEESIARIAGEDPADFARLVAASMDTRTQEDKDANEPAFDAAVIVDPKLRSAGAAAAFAASQRYPILFVDKASIPEATKQALEEFDIPRTFVVGGASAIEDSVLAELPDPKRLEGKGILGISRAVADTAIKQGVPRNVIYLVAPKQRMDVALAGASVARVGGLLLLTGKVGAARSVMSALQEQAMVDRYVKLMS